MLEFPLELSIDGKLQTIPITDKITTVNLPASSKPTTISVDPNVNLLASFEVAENK